MTILCCACHLAHFFASESYESNMKKVGDRKKTDFKKLHQHRPYIACLASTLSSRTLQNQPEQHPRQHPEQHPVSNTNVKTMEPISSLRKTWIQTQLKRLGTQTARGLWQMTFGAVNSGAGRIFATILSKTNVFSGLFLTYNILGREHPPYKWGKKIFSKKAGVPAMDDNHPNHFHRASGREPFAGDRFFACPSPTNVIEKKTLRSPGAEGSCFSISAKTY